MVYGNQGMGGGGGRDPAPISRLLWRRPNDRISVPLCSLQRHFIFLKTFVLATSGLEVRMQDWQAGSVVSIISLATVLSHKGEA